MSNKIIYTVDINDSNDGHSYTEGEKVDLTSSTIHTNKDDKVYKQFNK